MILSLPSTAVALLAAVAPAPEGGRLDAVERLAAALERFKAGDFAGSARVLAPAPVPAGRRRELAPLAPWVAYYRGEALFWAGEPDKSADAFREATGLDPDGPVALVAAAREGEALLVAGRATAAAKALQAALARRPRAELRLSLAEALAAQGDRAGALRELKRLFVEHPGHPAAREAERRLAREPSGAGLTSSDWAARAARHAARGSTRRSLSNARKALGLAKSPEERLRALLAQGRALAALRRDDEARRAFEEVAAPGGPAPMRAEARIGLARLLMRGVDLARAVQLLEEVAREFASEPLGDEAAFLAAWQRFGAGEPVLCVERFRAFRAERPRSKHADEALWYEGFCSHLAGDDVTAGRLFQELERASPSLAPQALYWRARTAVLPGEAPPLYQKVIAQAPATWYAWLARERLAALGIAPAAGLKPTADPPPAPPKGLREERAAQLAGLGLVREARLELDAAAKQAKTPEDAERIAALGFSLGLFDVSYRAANAKLWGRAFSKGSWVAMALLHPRAWAGEVRAAAAAVAIDPHLVWAIMRRESSFNPVARSAARAHGLMQLIFPTARKIAALVGAPRPGLAELQTPAHALPLAAWYLSELTGRFGHVALAAAAYNAGPRQVERWLRERGGLELDEFVERIPIKETRLYVKSVAADYLTYRALYGAADAPLPLPGKLPAPRAGAAF